MKRRILLAFILIAPTVTLAQLEPIPEERGATGLALALRKLQSGATFMHTTAHPDDEDNGLLVLMGRGRGLRTALFTVTRGDGGQNQIGPELFEALGILRTEELMALHRVDGAEQYFTLAYEFGYSFSVEETLKKWGKEETLGDMVRIIRTVRPDVMVCLPLTGEGGGQHHQTSGILTKEAFRAAADPNRFPEHIKEGLRPWQPLKLYSRVGFEGARSESTDPTKVVAVNTGDYDPVLGRSYAQMGAEARSFHRCQSMSQLRALPGPQLSRWILLDTALDVKGPEKDLFDGVDMGLGRLKDFVQGEGSKADFAVSGIDQIQVQASTAQRAFDASSPEKTIPALRAGLTATRDLRRRVKESALSEGARHELEGRLALKERQFMDALVLAHGVGFEATANRGDVVPGSKLLVNTQVAPRTSESLRDVTIELRAPSDWQQQGKNATAQGFLSGHPALEIASPQKLEAQFEVVVPEGARLSRPYWQRNPKVDRYDLLEPAYFGLPATPPQVIARLSFRSGGVDVSVEKPVQFRYNGPWVGTEKQREVSIVPKLSLAMKPQVAVFPVSATERARPVAVEVLYHGTGEATGSLRLEAPAGWTVNPTENALRFARENEAATFKFTVTPVASAKTGSYEVKAVATMGGRDYREGHQTIAYHHIHTRYLYHPATTVVEALDVKAEPVTVGYVMGVGDEIPEAITQLGATLTLLEEKDLAEADLSQFDVIVTGVRAYANREDLRAYNHRLLKYVEDGGTMLVFYNRQEWDLAQWGPYPSRISQDRITVEEAPIKILEPAHPLFRGPNAVTENDWKGWVQERGTYFLGERDPRYRDLLASEDPWPYNRGEKRGMLVEATYGKGRWLYCGLTLFRQLPEGVPDAYKLLANLLSLAKTAR